MPLFKRGKMVEGEGFEPSKHEAADLQSAGFDRSPTPPGSICYYQLRNKLVNTYIILNKNMKHFVNNRELFEQYPEGMSEIILGAGCFWGVERVFWKLEGVWVTYVSYSGGRRPNPNYEQVCTGVTGHAETVNVIFDKNIISLNEILKTFWECHDPTQGMRQGNDIGEQYRSVIYCNNDEDLKEAQNSKNSYSKVLNQNGFSDITTEIKQNVLCFPAEDYHQQYLAKNPNGYCGIKGTGCAFI